MARHLANVDNDRDNPARYRMKHLIPKADSRKQSPMLAVFTYFAKSGQAGDKLLTAPDSGFRASRLRNKMKEG
jgi:hypothetical protein